MLGVAVGSARRAVWSALAGALCIVAAHAQQLTGGAVQLAPTLTAGASVSVYVTPAATQTALVASWGVRAAFINPCLPAGNNGAVAVSGPGKAVYTAPQVAAPCMVTLQASASGDYGTQVFSTNLFINPASTGAVGSAGAAVIAPLQAPKAWGPFTLQPDGTWTYKASDWYANPWGGSPITGDALVVIRNGLIQWRQATAGALTLAYTVTATQIQPPVISGGTADLVAPATFTIRCGAPQCSGLNWAATDDVRVALLSQ